MNNNSNISNMDNMNINNMNMNMNNMSNLNMNNMNNTDNMYNIYNMWNMWNYYCSMQIPNFQKDKSMMSNINAPIIIYCHPHPLVCCLTDERRNFSGNSIYVQIHFLMIFLHFIVLFAILTLQKLYRKMPFK